ncbi:MAG TPA: NAD-dependent epimerase/dehydratase family protein, partial [Actinomycetota bacterium]|nr:NAD-dependent epimerase/dehydratase family protein [Actinomycetota bacterium]
GEMVEGIRKRQLPIVGDGAGVTSFIHVEDAAAATVAALERGAPGVYNVVDDEPAPSSLWVPELATAVGAKPPRHVPVWLAKPLIGDAGVWLMTKAPGASNAKAKAKAELGWTPRFGSWRLGFREGLGVETALSA